MVHLGWRHALVGGTVFGALLLRAWGVLSGELVWHPDEIFMVVFPLNFFSGDLNPHHFHYPTFHYYQLGVLYGADYVLQSVFGVGRELLAWIADRYLLHAEWPRDEARWLGIAYGTGTVVLAGYIGDALGGGVSDRRRGWLARLTSGPGMLAAAVMAVSVVHVRQSPIASVDTPLAFFFTAATCAALRLLTRQRWQDYALAGLLIGVSTATKYPGLASCLGIVAAHVSQRRSLLDRRLWIAAIAAVVTFASLSPYIILDFDTFRQHFLFQVAHAEKGRFGAEGGPLFHLVHSLRWSIGDGAWTIWLLSLIWGARRRSCAYIVVCTATLAAYAAVSWANLTFVRYILPVLPLQAAVVGEGIHRIIRFLSARHPCFPRAGIAVTVIAVALAQPLWTSVRLAEFMARRDTRTLAKEWFHRHVPAGSTFCNFGGWAGDVQVRTYEDQWWRVGRILTVWDERALPRLLGYLETEFQPLPFYSQALRAGHREQAAGDRELVHERQCAYIVTQEHPLPYSRIDSSFHAGLPAYAELRAAFDPGDLQDAVFDVTDAYYVPLSGFTAARPGPRIEIWEIPEYRRSPLPTSQRHVFSRVFAQTAVNAIRARQWGKADRTLRRALALDPANEYALVVRATMRWNQGDTLQARHLFEEILQRNPRQTQAIEALAKLAAVRGDFKVAISWQQRLHKVKPRDPSVWSNLADFQWSAGHRQRAVSTWTGVTSRFPEYGAGHYNLGTALLLLGQPERALVHLERALEIAPDSVGYYNNAASAYKQLARFDRAAELWRRAISLDAQDPETRINLAYLLQRDLRDFDAALVQWQEAGRLDPADVDIALNGGQVLLRLGRTDEAVTWLTRFLHENATHPRREEVDRALDLIAAARGRDG